MKDEAKEHVLFISALTVQRRFNECADNYRTAYEAMRQAEAKMDEAHSLLSAASAEMEAIAAEVVRTGLAVPDLVKDPTIARLICRAREHGKLCVILKALTPPDPTS
jgi:hypothetical protein